MSDDHLLASVFAGAFVFAVIVGCLFGSCVFDLQHGRRHKCPEPELVVVRGPRCELTVSGERYSMPPPAAGRDCVVTIDEDDYHWRPTR